MPKKSSAPTTPVPARTLDHFRQDPRNANRGTPGGPDAIAANMRANGFGRALLAAADNTLIAGNQASKGASLAGLAGADPIIVESDGTRPIIVRRTDIADASDPRFAGLSLGDNLVPLASREMDREVIAEILEEHDPVVLGIEDVIEIVEEPTTTHTTSATPSAAASGDKAVAEEESDDDAFDEDDDRDDGPADTGVQGEPQRLRRMYQIIVTCKDEPHQQETYEMLTTMGFDVAVQTL